MVSVALWRRLPLPDSGDFFISDGHGGLVKVRKFEVNHPDYNCFCAGSGQAYYALGWLPLDFINRMDDMHLTEHLTMQREWSAGTFGPAKRTAGVCDHIRKELTEIASNPDDLEEWVDVLMLAFDGFLRHGGKPEQALPMLAAKLKKNMARKWPDWRSMPEGVAIGHDRSGEA